MFSGHDFFDMAAYEAYLGCGLQPFELPDERIRETVGNLKRLYPFAYGLFSSFIYNESTGSLV